MRLMLHLLVLLVVVAALLFGYTRWQTGRIEALYPPVGSFVELDGYRMHVVHEAAEGGDLPPIVFLHGASGNLRDQLTAFRQPLMGRAELLFVDRPGHGYSERGGPENAYPDGQARAVAAVMDKLGIERAIISAHSFGAAIAASFALQFPEKTAGLLFLAPATHAWPGGVAWYYGVARSSFTGAAFTSLVSLPVGMGRVASGTRCVFAPNPMPADYAEETAPALVLRPSAFRYNATDVANLNAYVKGASRQYPDIDAPTIIITGTRDDVVAPEIHSRGLERDIADAKLIRIANMGHKPDYVANDLAVAAIEVLAGMERDLDGLADAVEARVADDDEKC